MLLRRYNKIAAAHRHRMHAAGMPRQPTSPHPYCCNTQGLDHTIPAGIRLASTLLEKQTTDAQTILKCRREPAQGHRQLET